MPSYTMRHKPSGETKEMILSISEREKFLEENPEWEQALASPGFVSQHGSNLGKTSGGWKDLLSRIKKGSSRTNTIKL